MQPSSKKQTVPKMFDIMAFFIMSVNKNYSLLFTKSSAKINKIATSVPVAGNLARKSGSKQYTVQGKQMATYQKETPKRCPCYVNGYIISNETCIN